MGSACFTLAPLATSATACRDVYLEGRAMPQLVAEGSSPHSLDALLRTALIRYTALMRC